MVGNESQFVKGMGGLGASFHSRDRLDITNPASVASLATTVFDGGFYIDRRLQRDNDHELVNWGGNLTNLSVGIPLQNEFNSVLNRKEPKIKWGIGLDLKPLSRVGYDFISLNYDANAQDTLNRSNIGEGGTYVVSIVNGWRYKQIAVGVRTGYGFGSVEYSSVTSLDANSPGAGFNFNTIERQKNNYRMFIWDVGVQYDHIFKYDTRADGSRGSANKYLTFGVTYHGDWWFRGEQDVAVYRENKSASILDTLLRMDDIAFDGQLPSEIGFGLSYIVQNKLRVGIDYRLGAWNDFSNDQVSVTPNVQNASKYSIGMSYTPNISSITNYFDRLTYYAGLIYAQDPRVLDGEQIKDISVRIGASLPVVSQRQVSYINLALSIGRLGVNDSYRENYYNLGISYTLTDNQWFIKRKYN